MLPAIPPHSIGPLRGARPARGRMAFSWLLALAVALPAPAPAQSGSGTARIINSNVATAGSRGQWTIEYRALEDFAFPVGGVIEFRIPEGWSLPQRISSALPGFIDYTNPSVVDSLTVNGRTVRLRVGGASPLRRNDRVSLLYGVGGGNALAVVQTNAPAVAPFTVSSDPDAGNASLPDTLASGSPFVLVVADTVASVRIVDAAGDSVGAIARSADQDTTHLYLRGYDRFGNSARWVDAAWSVLGGIGSVAPSAGPGTVFAAGSAGTGYVVADSGAWRDSTGVVTVTVGAYAALAATMSPAAVVGVPFAAAVEAEDADGNRIETGPGSAAAVRFVAYADSLDTLPADPAWVDSGALLASGVWTGTLTARRSGTFFVAARDSAAGVESSARQRLDVAPAAAERIELRPDTLRLTAGIPGILAVVARDAFGNRAPVAADEAVTLWTDRPSGRFESLGGAEIFEVVLASGADSAAFRFRDTEATVAAGRLRGIDANGAAPFLGTAEAFALTAPGAPAGTIALSAAPDTLVADGADSSRIVAAPVRDAYGNPVASGEGFTITATGVTPYPDEDPATAGVQWRSAADGTLAGWVRAGTTAGPALVQASSMAGSAAGTAALHLVPGAPSGPIALVASPDSLAADGLSTRTVGATGLADAFGNRVADGERYTVATTLGSIATPDADPGTAGVQILASGGVIAFDLLGGDLLGTAAVSASSVRGSAAGGVPVRLVPGDVSRDSSSAAADSTAVVGPPGASLTVTLRDGKGHALPGVPSDSIAVAVSGVPASITPLAPATDASGTIGFAVASTVAGPATLAVTARATPIAGAPAVLFVNGPLDTLVVSGPAGPLTAGNGYAITVLARDAFGNPTSDRVDTVRASVSAGAAAGLPAALALAGGSATFAFTPLASGTLAIAVADDSSHAAAYGPVLVVSGPPARVVLDPPASDTLAAGDSTLVLARVYDLYDNPVPGAAVAASVVAGAGSVAPAAVADGSGAAALTLHAGTAPGATTFRTASGTGADSVTVVTVAAPAASVSIAATGGSFEAGSTLEVTVIVRDAYGNVAVGARDSVWLRTTASLPDSVAWALASGAGSLADSAAGDGARYRFAPADGGTVVLRVRATRAEILRLRASGAGLPLAESNDVAVTAAAGASVALLSGDGQSAVVDHDLPQPLRVEVRDRFGNAAPGDSVRFEAVVGSGFVDAVRGGPVDPRAVTDASGVAACEVAHLGTAAGASSDRFRASLAALPGAEVFFTASALPDVAASLAFTPSSLALAAGAADTAAVTARDAHGNPTPGTSVTVYLGSAAAGSLESLGGSSGSATTQTGTADAAGRIEVRYVAPGTPGSYEVLARGTTIPPVSLPVTVGTSSIAALRVVPLRSAWTAGAPESVRVEARDAFGNLVLGAADTVVLGASDPVSFAPASGPLVQGLFHAAAIATLADTLVLTARVASGSAAAASAPVVVAPGPPAGAIAIVAGRDTLTADGRSSTPLTLGPLRDAFGNRVLPGTLLTVSASSGVLSGADASPLAGLQIATAADDSARALLVAPAAPGTDRVLASSVAGSARDSIAVVYVPPPSLAAAAGSLAPAATAPGQSVAFQLAVTNTAASGSVTIETGSSFTFGSGAGAFAASPLAPLVLAPGDTDTLRFLAATVSSAITPGSYAPALRLGGRDGTGEPFDFYLSLGGAQVHVAGVSVLAVGAAPDPVPLGSSVALTFRIENRTATAGFVTAAGLSTSLGTFSVVGVAPPLPAALPALGSADLTLTVAVPASGLSDGATVEATLAATAAFGPASVLGSNAAPLSFRVVSGARIAAEAGGAAPARYLRGRTFGPTVRVANGGSAAVTLDRGATRLLLTGGAVLQTGLAADAVVNGGGTAELAFDSLAVPAGTPLGSYAASLILSGSESGQAFADTIPLDPASVDVAEPALLAVEGGVQPDTVAAGRTRAMSVTLMNAGGVAFALDASTRLVLGPPVSTTLVPSATDTIPAGASRLVAFIAVPIGFASAPGTASAVLETWGREDGRLRAEALDAGTLVAVPPAQVTFVAGSTSPDTVRAGTTTALTLSIRNEAGASPLMVDPASTRLRVSDGVEEAVATASGAPFALAAGATAALSFPSVSFPPALASQGYPVELVVTGLEWGEAESPAVLSPAGEIQVVEPVPAVQVRGLATGAPTQVAPGDAFPFWALELQPLVPPGGAASSQLVAVRLTILADGSASASPAANVAQVTLRDAQGTLLAQAVPGAANPVLLPLSVPLAIGGGAVTVRVEASLQPDAAARAVALRLAADADLDVRDDLTQAAVPILGAGGLPFAPLTSDEVTLFAKAHGYPNPFRAGREEVRLSYRLAADATVRVAIYTLLGDLVRELSLPSGGAGGARGLNEVPWDGRNGRGELVRPGVYVARVEGGGVDERIKVGVLR